MKSIFVLLLLLSFIAGCAISGGKPTPEQLANENFGECPDDLQEKIMAIMNRRLFDPYSAMYSFVKPGTPVPGEKIGEADWRGEWVYRGRFGHIAFAKVNAKNRFGGYVGEKIYLFMCLADGSIIELPYIK